jgi:hypothetical protein
MIFGQLPDGHLQKKVHRQPPAAIQYFATNNDHEPPVASR